MNYEAEYPEDFDEYAWETVAKGWFGGLVVRAGGATYRPVVYDLTRFMQEAQDALASANGYLAETNLLVIAVVDRQHINQALEVLASRDFADLRAD